MNKDETTHRERVAEFVKEDPQLLKRLFEQAVDTRKKGFGPPKRAYAFAKHKAVVSLNGSNKILLEKLVDAAQAKMPEGKKSKESTSSFINMMIEYWLKHNNDLD